jgi:hypothetical protein
MGLFKLGKGRFSGLALTMGVCLTLSCGLIAQAEEPFPPVQTLPSVQTLPPEQAAVPEQTAAPEQAAAPAKATPPAAQDWRTLRLLDLPVQLVRATWSEDAYLSQGHPIRFGRTSVTMQVSGVINKTIVRRSNNAVDGLLIENLSCYNTVNGERNCTLLLNPPDRCYLFVYAESATSRTERSGTTRDESFDVLCPARLTLGR